MTHSYTEVGNQPFYEQQANGAYKNIDPFATILLLVNHLIQNLGRIRAYQIQYILQKASANHYKYCILHYKKAKLYIHYFSIDSLRKTSQMGTNCKSMLMYANQFFQTFLCLSAVLNRISFDIQA